MMAANLNQLVEVRSRLVEELILYLEDLARRMAVLPRYYPDHIRNRVSSPAEAGGAAPFDDLRQRVQVVEDRTALQRWMAEERERLRAAGQDPDHRAYAPNRSLPEGQDGDNGHPPPQTLIWDEVAAARYKRAIILGDPGFGKTSLLRYEARRLALEGLRLIRAQRGTPEDVILPIFLRLPDLNRTNAVEPTPFERLKAALLRFLALKQTEKPLQEIIPELAAGPLEAALLRPPSAAFMSYLSEKLGSSQCVVLLDALDEAPTGTRRQLENRLVEFAHPNRHCRLLLTSRIVGYNGSPIPGAQEMELLAFNMQQIEPFTAAWFRGKPEEARGFLRVLRENSQAGGLARIPLMLGLLCRVYEVSKGVPQRRTELYRQCLFGLLRDWKREDKGHEGVQVTDGYVEATLEVLQKAAYTLWQEGKDQFPEVRLWKEIRLAIRSLSREHDLHDLSDKKPADLVADLKRDGILVEAGKEGELLFLHRTFHEFLAARELACRDDWLKIVGERLYNSGSQEVLRLLGGCLQERAAPSYIALLLREAGKDLLLRPFRLAVFAVVEVEPGSLPGGFADEMCRLTVDLYLWPPVWVMSENFWPLIMAWGPKANRQLIAHLKVEAEWVRRLAIVGLGDIGSDEAVEPLIACLHDEYGEAYEDAKKALGKHGSEVATRSLIALLDDDAPGIREAAAEALGNTRSKVAVQSLIARLQDKVEWVRRTAIMTLGNIGSDLAVRPLIACLQDEDLTIRRTAAETLRKIGSEAAIKPLIARLWDDTDDWYWTVMAGHEYLGSDLAIQRLIACLHDEDEGVRRTAIVRLGTTGSEAAIELLIACLQHEVEDVRPVVAYAMGRSRSIAAMPSLIACLQDENIDVYRAAIEALGNIGSEAAIQPLFACLQDENKMGRYEVAFALGKIGSNAAIEPLIACIRDRSHLVRRIAAYGLGNVGGHAAIEPLIACLNDEDELVRIEAAQALGKSGTVAELRRTGSDAAIQSLIVGLQDASEHVRRVVAEALGNIGSDAAVKPLVACLRDQANAAHGVRRAAAVALGRIRSDVSIQPLIVCLQDRYVRARWAAAWAVGMIVHDRPFSVPNAHPPVHCEIDSIAEELKALAQRLKASNSSPPRQMVMSRYQVVLRSGIDRCFAFFHIKADRNQRDDSKM